MQYGNEDSFNDTTEWLKDDEIEEDDDESDEDTEEEDDDDSDDEDEYEINGEPYFKSKPL